MNDETVGGKSLLFANYSKEYLPQADDLVRYLEVITIKNDEF